MHNFYLGLFKLWIEAKLGHKVGAVMDSCESLEVITTGLLIKASYFCILRHFVVDFALYLACFNMQPL